MRLTGRISLHLLEASLTLTGHVRMPLRPRTFLWAGMKFIRLRRSLKIRREGSISFGILLHIACTVKHAVHRQVPVFGRSRIQQPSLIPDLNITGCKLFPLKCSHLLNCLSWTSDGTDVDSPTTWRRDGVRVRVFGGEM